MALTQRVESMGGKTLGFSTRRPKRGTGFIGSTFDSRARRPSIVEMTGSEDISSATDDSAVPFGHVFVFGPGYTGMAFCRLVKTTLGQQTRVSVSCRSGPGWKERAAELEASPWIDDAYPFYPGVGFSPAGSTALSDSTHVLVTCPPNTGSIRDPLLACHEGTLRSSPRLQWVGYLSTTGIYGDHGGGWVTEATPPTQPPSPRAAARLAAEQEWLADSGLPVHIFRLAGIYGPGRSAIDTVLRGESKYLESASEEAPAGSRPTPSGARHLSPCKDISNSEKSSTGDKAERGVQWVSRVHVGDICTALLASCRHPRPGAIYNVADDCPAPRAAVLDAAAALIAERRGAAPVAYLDPGRRGPARRERAVNENKRVGAGLLAAELGWRPNFPDYLAGLRDIVSSMGPHLGD